MKGRSLLFDQIAGRKAAALMIDGRLDDFLVESPEDGTPQPGAIFRAVAEQPLKGQGGMILALPSGAKAFFRQAKGLRPGQNILVQVTSHAEKGKAVPVTDRVIFKGRTVIITPSAGGINVSRQIKDDEMREMVLAAVHTEIADASPHGVIVRSAATTVAPDEISHEVDSLIELANAVLKDPGTGPELLVDAPAPHELGWRDWSRQPQDEVVEAAGCFETHGVLDALEALSSPEVQLGGGSIFIEPTRALVAVDVNTGSDFSPAAGLKANLACARALPRELRLRGLGGQIVLDLAPMPKKDRRQFEQALRSAFRADAIETALVGWTPLGHFELQRKRERLPLPKGLT